MPTFDVGKYGYQLRKDTGRGVWHVLRNGSLQTNETWKTKSEATKALREIEKKILFDAKTYLAAARRKKKEFLASLRAFKSRRGTTQDMIAAGAALDDWSRDISHVKVYLPTLYERLGLGVDWANNRRKVGVIAQSLGAISFDEWQSKGYPLAPAKSASKKRAPKKDPSVRFSAEHIPVDREGYSRDGEYYGTTAVGFYRVRMETEEDWETADVRAPNKKAAILKAQQSVFRHKPRWVDGDVHDRLVVKYFNRKK